MISGSFTSLFKHEFAQVFDVNIDGSKMKARVVDVRTSPHPTLIALQYHVRWETI
jgi:hypothetical protein